MQKKKPKTKTTKKTQQNPESDRTQGPLSVLNATRSKIHMCIYGTNSR